MKRFYDYSAVRQRVENSVIRYRGDPVYVLQVRIDEDFSSTDTEHIFLELFHLVTGNRQTISAEDAELDISSPPLGYINVGEEQRTQTYYLERIPVRRWKSGVTASNSQIITPVGSRGGQQRPPPDWFRFPAFGRMVLGDYPSFSTVFQRCAEALEAAAEDHFFYSEAFDRDFALATSPQIGRVGTSMLYKGCRFAELRCNKFEIQPKFRFLKEMLDIKGFGEYVS